jgi:DNA-binding NarL/FixJ family response regulator
MITIIGFASNRFIASYITEIAKSVSLNIQILFDIQQVVKTATLTYTDWIIFDVYENPLNYFEIISRLRITEKRFRLAILVDNSVMNNKDMEIYIRRLNPDLVCGFHELPSCLKSIALGQRFLPLLPQRPITYPIPGWKELTEREKEVLWDLAEGKPAAEIANHLFISTKTVENHKSSISSKLNVTGGPGSLLRFVFKNRVDILSTKLQL